MKHTVFMTLIVAGAVSLTALSAQAHGPRGQMPSFSELDANQDGALSVEELNAHRTARFASADADGNGSLSAEELQAGAAERAQKRSARMIERLDTDGDGELSQAELETRGGKARDGSRMFERLDADKDGSISEAEFAEAEGKMRRHGRRGGDSN